MKTKVQEVILSENSRRYILVDKEGIPIIIAVKYLKYLDNIKKSRNTQKTYCYALKLYFEYLKEVNKRYEDINIDDLANFVGWLRNPYSSTRVTPINGVKAKRCEKTINLIITVITNFYDYLYRSDILNSNVFEKLMRTIHLRNGKVYKDFLYHINKNKPSMKNILKLKLPKEKIRVLTKDEMEKIYSNTTNIRDKFLIRLLFETGLRIGEALSLFIEDIIYDQIGGHRIKLKNRGELCNGAKLKTGEREIYISQELINLFDDYMYEILDELEVDTNFLFVKLKGKNIAKPMTYQDVDALMKRLKTKTNINIHSHLLRHTHATVFYKQTKDIKQVQERLGHSNIQTTMDFYLHLSEEDIRTEWGKAESAFKFNI